MHPLPKVLAKLKLCNFFFTELLLEPELAFKERVASLLYAYLTYLQSDYGSLKIYTYIKKSKAQNVVELLPSLLQAIYELQQQKLLEKKNKKTDEDDNVKEEQQKRRRKNMFFKSVITQLSKIVKEVSTPMYCYSLLH